MTGIDRVAIARSADQESAPFSDQALSRRTLLRATVITSGALTVGVTACTADTAPSASGAATALSGALANPFRELDPTTATSVATYTLNNLFIYESLYRQDPTRRRAEVQPELAVGMPQEVTPTRYQVNLREGVTFHDGSPLTAEDVVFTIERMKDDATKSFFASFLGIITAARVTSKTSLELDLAAPTTLLADRLSLVRVISKRAVAASEETLALKPIGSGPYQVTTAVSGQEISMKKFKGYNGDRQVTYDELAISCITDPTARISSLRTGQSKVVEDVPPGSIKELAKASNLHVEALPGPDRTIVFFNCGKAPFSDHRARQAILYAVDRDNITRSVYFGKAEAAWDGEVTPTDPDYAKPTLTYRYDPAYARQLLAQAGQSGKPIPIDVIVDNDAADRTAQAPIIEQNLKDVGFQPTMIPMAASAMTSRIAEGRYHLALTKATTANILATADFHLRFLYYGAFVRQLAFWEGPATDKLELLLDQAQAAPDEATRKQQLAQVQELIQAEVPIATLHRRHAITGWSSQLSGFRPLPGAGFLLDGVRG